MNFKGIKVLILEGYTRQSLPLIHAFHNLGCCVSVLCSSKMDLAYVSRYTDHRILGVCNRERPEDTMRQVLQLLSAEKFDLAVPTSDFSARLLSENKKLFSKYARIASADMESYEIAGDKLKTMEVCMRNQIPCPATLLNARSREEVLNTSMQYPIVMKPRVGYGAIGFRKLETPGELKAILEKSDVCIEDYVFQEYIPQTDLQYECAVFMDEREQAQTALVFSKNRWFPVNGGSSTLNITVDRPDIAENCEKLLKKIHWRGAADVDLIQDPRDGAAKIMEINPRVSGSVKICFEAGADQARQMLELAFGEEVTQYAHYTEGIRLRCTQTDLLWFLKSPNRFRCKPSWFSWHKTKEQIFYLNDPLPWLFFSLHGILNYRKEMRKRS